ncbi:MAG: hypothetical protein WCO00_17000 [Rhodospirillaceae bacterium]
MRKVFSGLKALYDHYVAVRGSAEQKFKQEHTKFKKLLISDADKACLSGGFSLADVVLIDNGCKLTPVKLDDEVEKKVRSFSRVRCLIDYGTCKIDIENFIKEPLRRFKLYKMFEKYENMCFKDRMLEKLKIALANPLIDPIVTEVEINDLRLKPVLDDWRRFLGVPDSGYTMIATPEFNGLYGGVNVRYRCHLTISDDSIKSPAKALDQYATGLDLRTDIFVLGGMWTYEVHCTLECGTSSAEYAHIYFGGRDNRWPPPASDLTLFGVDAAHSNQIEIDARAKVQLGLDNYKGDMLVKCAAALANIGRGNDLFNTAPK